MNRPQATGANSGSLALSAPPTLESLLEHADWVRSLARQLVRDPGAADDVAQEVWVEAVRRPPTSGDNPRSWLAAVARNAARQLKRGEARRTQRERWAARHEALPSAAQLVEGAALSRELADLVLELDEPYRTTLLLRYFRGLSIDEVARAQALPRETVRTRQQRGLEFLRERLDTTRGGRAGWLAAFAPLAKSPSPTAAAASGSALIVWSLAALLAVLVGGWWFVRSRSRAEPALAVAPERSAAPIEVAPGDPAPAGAAGARTQTATAADSAGSARSSAKASGQGAGSSLVSSSIPAVVRSRASSSSRGPSTSCASKAARS